MKKHPAIRSELSVTTGVYTGPGACDSMGKLSPGDEARARARSGVGSFCA